MYTRYEVDGANSFGENVQKLRVHGRKDGHTLKGDQAKNRVPLRCSIGRGTITTTTGLYAATVGTWIHCVCWRCTHVLCCIFPGLANIMEALIKAYIWCYNNEKEMAKIGKWFIRQYISRATEHSNHLATGCTLQAAAILKFNFRYLWSESSIFGCTAGLQFRLSAVYMHSVVYLGCVCGYSLHILSGICLAFIWRVNSCVFGNPFFGGIPYYGGAINVLPLRVHSVFQRYP